MGARGPVPKRSEERRRTNDPVVPVVKVATIGKVEIPKAAVRWHPLAKRMYNALKDSGQAKFYEPSDWATAYLLAECLTRDLRGDLPINGASLAAYLKGFASLGVTEGDRRRMGIEISRKPEKPKLAEVSVMDEYRAALGG